MPQKNLTRRWVTAAFDALLIALILVGVAYRFLWTDWSQGANLHPDEYGLTGTLTQLSIPQSLGDYFNTRISSISPYDKYSQTGRLIQNGPDNRMRWGQWPIILIRGLGELTGNTGYGEIRLMGRSLSALMDTLALLFIFLIGRRLYGFRAGLLAAALSALAVMQIQQSHFMTSDTFAIFFTTLTLYAAVRIAQTPGLVRRPRNGAQEYVPSSQIWKWYVLFGVAFGMTLASRVNLLPLGGMALLAALLSIADLRLRSSRDLERIATATAHALAACVLVTLVTFRVTQPMTFRAATGDTTLLTLNLNPDWVESMKVAQAESNGTAGGPPAEQWANRPAIVFPWVNMVFWGMGLPLGIAAWVGFLWAAWRLLKGRPDWRAHLLPLVWVGGYFLFMGTRWVKSIRYFLPIYPFLCLLAAWMLLELWRRRSGHSPAGAESPRKSAGAFTYALPALVVAVVVLGSLAWATTFVRTVYLQDHTRIQATKWIFQNVPAPFQVSIDTPSGPRAEPVPAPNGIAITQGTPFVQQFTATASGRLSGIALSHAAALSTGDKAGQLRVRISLDPAGSQVVDETTVPVDPGIAAQRGNPAQAGFHQAAIAKGVTYYLTASVDGVPVQVTHTVIANETWDEGLPVPFEGYDPFGGLYNGIDLQVRWPDNEDKRQMLLDGLARADYIILPSQRAIWSSCRIPLTYPMTMEYYRALFDGRLGFDLVASFAAPLKLGPLEISDVGGTAAWNKAPSLPLFNYNLLAAEEAFSVYDHPPVWIFKKRAGFDLAAAQAVLDSVDLNNVVIQSPRDATMVLP